jgi:hypothetical protein
VEKWEEKCNYWYAGLKFNIRCSLNYRSSGFSDVKFTYVDVSVPRTYAHIYTAIYFKTFKMYVGLQYYFALRNNLKIFHSATDQKCLLY